MMSGDARRRRISQLLLVGVLAFATAMAGLAVPFSAVPSAQASTFNPGNIISDSIFYDRNAMSASAVQNFLDSRISGGQCAIGQNGRKPGDPADWNGPTKFASNCLNNYRMDTESVPSNSYCDAYPGVKNESAAEIIAKVGHACEVSQEVLLITLQKEQSLVTHPSPTEKQFSIATGYGCPDSGADWSANCDSRYFGFQIQVYNAAWQFRHYSNPEIAFNFQPFQTRTIQYHPNPACGATQVYLENRATAALYNYTPYQPNLAALNVGLGQTGDGCSSYGNRNFFLLYTSWFGNPQGGPRYLIPGGILTYWNSNKYWLNQPTGEARSVPANGGGLLQDFEGGFVYASKAGAPVGFTSTSPLIAAFAAAGGIEGLWGWPISPAVSYGSGNTVVRFQGGAVVETAGLGVFLIPEATRAAWEASGGFGGSLGPPTGATVAAGTSARTVQGFQRGELYASSEGTAVLSHGPIRDAYSAAGGVAGSWGWPIGDSACVEDNVTCLGYFENGVVTVTPEFGVIFTGKDQASSPLNLVNPPGNASGRLGGSDRFSTAVEVSLHGFPDPATVDTVIVASGENYPDALSAAAMGGNIAAPLLLTEAAGLPAVTRSEIERLNPNRIIVVGGSGVVHESVYSALRSLVGGDDSRIERVFGADRYATSLSIAERGWTETGGSTSAFIATGEGFADALSAGAAAGKLGAPVILVPSSDAPASNAVQDRLTRLGVTEIYIAGGTGAVSDQLRTSLAAGRTVTRFAGADRYATSIEIVRGIFDGRANMYLATGESFADALAGAAVAGAVGSPLLLTAQNCIPETTYDLIDRFAGARTYLLGGSGTLTEGVQHGNQCLVRKSGVNEQDHQSVQALYSRVNAARFNAGLSGYRIADTVGSIVSARTFIASVNRSDHIENIWSKWQSGTLVGQEILRPIDGPKPQLYIGVESAGDLTRATFLVGLER